MFCRWLRQQIIGLLTQVPVIAPDTWIAPNAVLVGDVDLFDKVRMLLQPAAGLPCVHTQQLWYADIYLVRLCFERRFKLYPNWSI